MKRLLLAVAAIVVAAPAFAGEFKSERFFKTEAQLNEAASVLSASLDKSVNGSFKVYSSWREIVYRCGAAIFPSPLPYA